MIRQRAELDRSRSYASVHGDASYRYEQDGKQFDHQGFEILADEAKEHIAMRRPEGTDEAVSRDVRSSAAQRMRRTRQRRRAGIIAVVNVEIRQEVVDWLVARNLISLEEADDRNKIAAAVQRELEIWCRS